MSQKRKWLDNMNWRGIWWDNFHELNKQFTHLVQPSAELHHELSLGSVNIFFVVLAL